MYIQTVYDATISLSLPLAFAVVLPTVAITALNIQEVGDHRNKKDNENQRRATAQKCTKKSINTQQGELQMIKGRYDQAGRPRVKARITLTKMTLASLFGTWRAQGLNPLAAYHQLLASPQL